MVAKDTIETRTRRVKIRVVVKRAFRLRVTGETGTISLRSRSSTLISTPESVCA